MEIMYHGHSCVQLADGGESLIIDPFLTGNPKATAKPEDIRVNTVLLTHGHSDHIGDALAIAKRNDATIVATFELANYFGWKGAKTLAMNIGGSCRVGQAEVKMTHAFHSSSVIEEEGKIVYAGMPAGFVIRWGGKTVYHAGDTGLFGDLKMIGERHDIDLAFLPIGDLFTMGPDDAATAASWLRAKKASPLHYNTWPPIEQDAAAFSAKLQKAGIEGVILTPGQPYTL